MGSLDNILGKPKFVDGIGNIYPVKVKNYDLFFEHCNLFTVNNHHLGDTTNQYNLLDLIVWHGLQGENAILKSLEILFSLVTKKDVFLVDDSASGEYAFMIDEHHAITRDNYDIMRKIVLEQNVLFEHKVYKNKLVEEWAMKAMKAKQKNAANITFEDIITTVVDQQKISYAEVEEYTIYQLKSSFERINKRINFESAMIAAMNGVEKVTIPHFAESIDLYKNPYDDLFVNKNKLNNLDKAIK